MNSYWDDIRKHYRKSTPHILRAKKNEWAVDPYAWAGVISLTPIEEALWSDIRAVDAVLYPQYPIAGYFVDFANPKAKVAVECDGKAYHLDKEKDAARDAELSLLGWEVWRISGSACMHRGSQVEGMKDAGRNFINAIDFKHGICADRKKKNDYSFQEALDIYLVNILEKYS